MRSGCFCQEISLTMISFCWLRSSLAESSWFSVLFSERLSRSSELSSGLWLSR